MEYAVFWHLNPKKLMPFIAAYRQTQLRMRDNINFAAWLTGVYVTNAIGACFGKNHRYPNEPISFETADAEAKGDNEAKKFEAYAIAFNQQFKNKTAQSAEEHPYEVTETKNAAV